MALDLAEREGLAAWRDRFCGERAALRPVPAESLHVTLFFLGSQDASAVRGLLPAPPLEPIALLAGEVRVVGRPPRLLALSLGDPTGQCGQLAMAVASVFSGLREPERRAFWPHVTLARMRAGARLGTLPAPGSAPPALTGAALTLYRSDLRPTGAEYEPVERLWLRA